VLAFFVGLFTSYGRATPDARERIYRRRVYWLNWAKLFLFQVSRSVPDHMREPRSNEGRKDSGQKSTQITPVPEAF
jgi:hypothetical protein